MNSSVSISHNFFMLESKLLDLFYSIKKLNRNCASNSNSLSHCCFNMSNPVENNSYRIVIIYNAPTAYRNIGWCFIPLTVKILCSFCKSSNYLLLPNAKSLHHCPQAYYSDNILFG